MRSKHNRSDNLLQKTGGRKEGRAGDISSLVTPSPQKNGSTSFPILNAFGEAFFPPVHSLARYTPGKKKKMMKSEAISLRESDTGKQNLECSFLYKAAHYTEILNSLSRIILCCGVTVLGIVA